MASTYFQTVDILNVPSRNFYERAKAKQTAALYLGAVGMMFLGFCSETAGKANMQAFLSSNTTGTQKQIATDLAGGYGFASFCYIIDKRKKDSYISSRYLLFSGWKTRYLRSTSIDVNFVESTLIFASIATRITGIATQRSQLSKETFSETT
eukprot:gene12583-26497_t